MSELESSEPVLKGEIHEMPSSDAIQAFLDACQRAWCLRDVIRNANNSNDAADRLWQSSGNVYTRAPRDGFACFSDGCRVVASQEALLNGDNQLFTNCKYPDTDMIKGEVTAFEIEA